jgi:hypothetical protein
MTNVFAQVAVVDPCYVARKKSQLTLYVFLKTLPTGPYVEHNLMLIGTPVPPKSLAGGNNQGWLYIVGYYQC